MVILYNLKHYINVNNKLKFNQYIIDMSNRRKQPSKLLTFKTAHSQKPRCLRDLSPTVAALQATCYLGCDAVYDHT
jgi:hypothetical protein